MTVTLLSCNTTKLLVLYTTLFLHLTLLLQHCIGSKKLAESARYLLLDVESPLTVQ